LENVTLYVGGSGPGPPSINRPLLVYDEPSNVLPPAGRTAAGFRNAPSGPAWTNSGSGCPARNVTVWNSVLSRRQVMVSPTLIVVVAGANTFSWTSCAPADCAPAEIVNALAAAMGLANGRLLARSPRATAAARSRTTEACPPTSFKVLPPEKSACQP
jgi:hypothetical protein